MPAEPTALRACALMLATLAPACGGGPHTAIVVEVRTDLQVPAEIDRLTITVRQADQTLLSRDFGLGPEAGRWRLPAKLALVPAQRAEQQIRVEALGRRGRQVVLARSLLASFVDDTVLELPIDLSRACVGVLCPMGKTCVAGQGCTSLATAPVDQMVVPPACDCQSYFPVCLGARWVYEDVSGPSLNSGRTFTIQEYARLDGAPHGKADRFAFAQFRLLDGGLSRRWLGIETQNGARRLQYEKDDWFDDQWNPVLTSFYVPGKLRVDETRTTVGDSWSVEHEQYNYRAGAPPEAPWKVTSEWTVVDPSFDLRVAGRWPGVVCHRRVARELEDLPAGEAVYCFARGIGKVYDYTPGDDEEMLTSYEVPGCSRGGFP